MDLQFPEPTILDAAVREDLWREMKQLEELMELGLLPRPAYMPPRKDPEAIAALVRVANAEAELLEAQEGWLDEEDDEE